MNTNNENEMNENGLMAFIMSLVGTMMSTIDAAQGLLNLSVNDDGTQKDNVTVGVKAHKDGMNPVDRFTSSKSAKHFFGTVPYAVVVATMQRLMVTPVGVASTVAKTVAYNSRDSLVAVVDGVTWVSTYAFFGKSSPTSRSASKAGVTQNGVKVTAHSSPAYFLLNNVLLSAGFRILTTGLDNDGWKALNRTCYDVLRGLGAKVASGEERNVIYQPDRLAQLIGNASKVEANSIGEDEARSASIEAGLTVVEAGQQTTTVKKAQRVYDLDL